MRTAKGSSALSAGSGDASAAPAAGRARAGLVALAVLAAMAVAAAPASASTSVHVFSFAFGNGGTAPADPYPLSVPTSVSVDGSGGPSTGDVYVADPANAWVEKFDAAGNLVWIIGDGVDQTSGGNLCTAASGDTCQPGAQGSAPGQFIAPQFVAVDGSSGDVYVGDQGDNVVQKFDPDGNLVSTWGTGGQLNGSLATGGPFTGIAGIAVDPAGKLSVLDPNSGNWFRFAPDGTPDPTVTLPAGQVGVGIAVDAAGDLFAVTGAGNLEEYDPSGADLGDVTADTPDTISGVAVDPATGDVYADDGGSSFVGTSIRHYDGSTLPGCVSAAACTATQTFGSGNMSNALGLGVNPVNGTVYAADHGTSDIPVFTVFPPAPPLVDREWATGVDSSSASLHAEINPHVLDTTCTVQYGTDTAYASGSAACSPSDLGAGTGDVGVTASLTGLAAGTTYHYRFVAVNADGTTDGPDHTFTTFSLPGGTSQSCPNAQFRTGPSASLPDCRAWEQVSPVDKNGQDAFHVNGLSFTTGVRAAPDGNGFMYQSDTGYGAAQGSGLPDGYLAARTATGWQTANVTPPTPDPGPPGGFGLDYEFSPDLSRAVYEVPDQALAPGAEPGVANLFLRHTDGSFSLVTTAPRSVGCPAGNPFGPVCFQIRGLTTFAGASSDYGHVIFESNDCLTPDAPCGGVENLYEEVGGHVSLVGYLPDGAAAQGSQPGSGEIAQQTPGFAMDVTNAISADGSRVFFDAPADGGAPDPAQNGLTELYERVNGSSTVEISAPAAGATPANSTAEPATYWGATADGSLVLFTSSAELTTDANTGSGNAGTDLYEFNTGTGTLTDLSVDSNPADAATGANVQGVVGASADGSYVYFVANGQLVPGQGTDGQPNLYLEHAGQVSFIATLSPNDSLDWTNQTAALQSYVTPDGQHLALMSTMSLTGYDNTDQSTGQPDSEVFEYSAGAGQLVCASCDPSGAEPVGNALIEVQKAAGGTANTSSPFYQTRVLSDDGSRLFFTSPDALTPGASTPYYKVYEYEHGTVSLLEAAATGDDFFLDASPSGDDAFIVSRDQLAPSDQDQLNDVYDARVDGGFPAPATTPPCQADGCQGSPTPAPALPVAATVSFTGPGNATAPASRPAGKVKVLHHTVSGDAFVLTVRVPQAGTLAISGRWLKAVRRRVSRAGSYRLTVRLTAAGRRALSRRGRLGVTVRVRYQPNGAAASTATVHATFTQPRRVRRRARTAAQIRQPAARRPR